MSIRTGLAWNHSRAASSNLGFNQAGAALGLTDPDSARTAEATTIDGRLRP